MDEVDKVDKLDKVIGLFFVIWLFDFRRQYLTENCLPTDFCDRHTDG